MSEPALRFDRVSKVFKGYVHQSLGTALVNRVRGRAPNRERVHALRDVSFEVSAGESVALMGLNGSGKTTALSLVARISTPTSGTISYRGRVGALLAVGTGLHGEMTGRENIDVYCRILGYSSAQIRRQFDEIVQFAEIGYALDRPLKFYSSGMQLRLGFSIAAHVDPEIMLVDEAVSVGDVLFQQRCLDKMSDLVRGGSALVLVSHQPDIVARTCRTGLLLRQGELVSRGPTDQIISEYLEETGRVGQASLDDALRLVEWDITDFDFDAKRGRISAVVDAPDRVDDPRFGVTIADLQHGPLISASMVLEERSTGDIKGRYAVSCELKDIPLRAGIYRVVLYATSTTGGQFALSPHVLGHLRWGDATVAPVAVGKGAYGPVVVPTSWSVEPD